MKRTKGKMIFGVVIYCMCVMAFVGCGKSGQNVTGGSLNTVVEVSEQEKQEVISILNTTPYMSNVPTSYTYGQVLESAFIEYAFAFEKMDDSVIKVTISGIFMDNPEIESSYNEVANALGKEKALETYGMFVYERSFSFTVDLVAKTCGHSDGSQNSALQAYALGTF